MLVTGIFISLEGPDGAGKSTAAQSLVPLMEQVSQQEVVLTREPGGSQIAEQIRQVILDINNSEMDQRTEALLYAAARRQHLVDVILPALAANKIVLSDRYIDSSVAYQGAGRQIGTQAVWQLNMFATEQLLPQLTLYLDVPAEVGLSRIQHQRTTGLDRLEQEQLAFHKRVQQAYMQLLQDNPQRIKRVDATQAPAQVVQNCLQIMMTQFKWAR